MRRKHRLLTGLSIAAILGAVLMSALTSRSGEPKKLRYDELVGAVERGEIKTIELVDGSSAARGELTDGTKFAATYPSEAVADLTALIRERSGAAEIEIQADGESLWVSFLLAIVPILVLGGLFYFIIQSTQGGGGRVMAFGRSRAKLVTDDVKVTFADVAGADEAVEELHEIKEFLREPARFQGMGARIPKGVLLFGPPGTGKTLLARAVAGEADVPFFSISGSDFVEMFVGVGASRVRDLFDKAKKAAPAIIFIDEIDAVGRHRGAGLGGGHDEREQTLNQMLVEMDGFDANSGVIVMAATNRPDILDPALLRPGRFDRQIMVDRPDLEGRKRIVGVHAKGKPLSDDISADVIARRTPGFTGADLSNLLNEAALLATRRDKTEIDQLTLEAAIDRVLAGPERKGRVMSDRERQTIAYHEAGHALVGHVLPNTDPIHKVSIIARGRALGWTLALPTDDRNLRTRSELRDELAMLLGGRAAEDLIFGDPSTGAANDIERVTGTARAMVTEYGMSDAIGPMQLGARDSEVFLGKELGHEANYSDAVAAAIDAEIKALVGAAYAEAREILSLHRATLDRLADALIAHETLDEQALDGIWGDLHRGAHNFGRRATDCPMSPAAAAPRTVGPVVSEAGDR